MKSTIAVIGLGIFGREVALSLASRGLSVVAIDSNPDMVEPLKDLVAQALVLDSTLEEALVDAQIERLSTVVNAIGTDHIQNSIMTTALLSHLGVKRIIARASSDLHERILFQVGAHEVVNPEREMGRRIAQRIALPHFNEILRLPDGVCVAEVPLPAGFIGRSLAEVAVRAQYGVNVIGVKRVPLVEGGSILEGDAGSAGGLEGETHRMIINLSPTQDRFIAGDVLIVIGPEHAVNRLGQVG